MEKIREKALITTVKRQAAFIEMLEEENVELIEENRKLRHRIRICFARATELWLESRGKK